MNIIETIHAEIERRKKKNQWSTEEGSEAAFKEDSEILAFLDSLKIETQEERDRSLARSLSNEGPHKITWEE